MNPIKKLLIAALAAACLFSLTGCSLFSHSFDPKGTGIYIASDRSVTSAEITDFDNSAFDTPRYVASEFETYARDTVKAFNKEKAGVEAYSADDTDQKLPAAIEKLEGLPGFLRYDRRGPRALAYHRERAGRHLIRSFL